MALFPRAQAPGAMSLQSLLDPQVALPMAAALMGNQGNSGNFSNALFAAGQGIGQQREVQAQQAQQNRTVEFLRQQAPELAGMVDAGMPVNEAWRSYMESRQAQKSNLINAGDGQLYDPSTGSWISAPNREQKAPQIVELFDEASGQPYKAKWNPETGQYDRVGGVKARSGMYIQTNPDGTTTVVQGDLTKAPKLTVDEAKNAGFLERTRKSNAVIDELEKEGQSAWNRGMQAVPMGMGNYGLSANAQKFQQAKRDFVNAILRRESGAVISPEEFANAEQQYFPQPGDTKEVVEQKRTNRAAALRGLEIGSGQGAGMVSPAPAGGGGVVDYTDFFGGQ